MRSPSGRSSTARTAGSTPPSGLRAEASVATRRSRRVAGTASAPQISIDSAGKAVAVWYRFEGMTDRIQAAVRPAGGSFGTAVTLSDPSIEAFEPQVVAGPNADANAAVVWTGSDGTNLRIQASRRRDVVGFPRPKGATPIRVSLVPAYSECTSANRTHGPGLVFPSCNPPVRSSSTLTVGSSRRERRRRQLHLLGEIQSAHRQREHPGRRGRRGPGRGGQRRPQPPGADRLRRPGDGQREPADHRQPERRRAARARHGAGPPVQVRGPLRDEHGRDKGIGPATSRRPPTRSSRRR